MLNCTCVQRALLCTAHVVVLLIIIFFSYRAAAKGCVHKVWISAESVERLQFTTSSCTPYSTRACVKIYIKQIIIMIIKNGCARWWWLFIFIYILYNNTVVFLHRRRSLSDSAFFSFFLIVNHNCKERIYVDETNVVQQQSSRWPRVQ